MVEAMSERFVLMGCLVLVGVCTAVQAAAEPSDENTAIGLVIQCPYIPEGVDPVPLCQGRPATCVGTDGDDVLWGTEDDEVIMALGGDDVVQADAGDDIICLGPGDDTAHGAQGDDFIFGGDGNDSLFGARGSDSLYGEGGRRDVLFGGPEEDYLDGGPGEADVCLQQRDDATVNESTCEVVFPPLGFTHSRQDAIPPGVVESAVPQKAKQP